MAPFLNQQLIIMSQLRRCARHNSPMVPERRLPWGRVSTRALQGLLDAGKVHKIVIRQETFYFML